MRGRCLRVSVAREYGATDTGYESGESRSRIASGEAPRGAVGRPGGVRARRPRTRATHSGHGRAARLPGRDCQDWEKRPCGVRVPRELKTVLTRPADPDKQIITAAPPNSKP